MYEDLQEGWEAGRKGKVSSAPVQRGNILRCPQLDAICNPLPPPPLSLPSAPTPSSRWWGAVYVCQASFERKERRKGEKKMGRIHSPSLSSFSLSIFLFFLSILSFLFFSFLFFSLFLCFFVSLFLSILISFILSILISFIHSILISLFLYFFYFFYFFLFLSIPSYSSHPFLFLLSIPSTPSFFIIIKPTIRFYLQPGIENEGCGCSFVCVCVCVCVCV